MQSHSPSGAVLNPSQFMYNRSSHNSHCTMSSQDSGIEQRQNKLVSQVWLFWNLAVFGYRGKGSKTTSLQTLNIRQDASSNALTIRMFWIKSILWYALERKVSSIFTRTLRMVFSLSFVGGSKFAEGGPNPPGHRDDVSSHLKYYQLSSEILDYKLILFRSSHFDHDVEKNTTVIGMF